MHFGAYMDQSICECDYILMRSCCTDSYVPFSHSVFCYAALFYRGEALQQGNQMSLMRGWQASQHPPMEAKMYGVADWQTLIMPIYIILEADRYEELVDSQKETLNPSI